LEWGLTAARPFSTRALRQCLTEGAARFGWDKRSPQPRSMRDGRTLIGQGVAAAIFTHWRWPGKARVTLDVRRQINGVENMLYMFSQAASDVRHGRCIHGNDR
jgi:CO/xanthine dehydrogenase Mo-binding subunit